MRLSNQTDHAQHDVMLIAGHAAGDLLDADRGLADTLLATCESCSDLRRDLVAIAAATRSMPALVAARDFRLTPEQAERLSRGSWLRTLLRPFAAPRSAVRPMAAAFTTLGIAGLFVATMSPALFGAAGPAAAPVGNAVPGLEAEGSSGGGFVGVPAAGGPAAAPAATAAAAATDNAYAQARTAAPLGSAVPVRVTSGDRDEKSMDAATAAPGVAMGSEDRASGDMTAAGGGGGAEGQGDDARLLARAAANPLALGSLGLLGLGLLLFGLRFAARRVR